MDLLVGSDHYPLLLRSAGNRKPINEKGSLTWIRFGKNAVYTIWFNFLCFLLTLILSLSTPRNQVLYHRDYFLASRFCYRSFSHFFIQGTLDFLLGFFSWSSSQFKQGLFSTVPHFNLEQQCFLGQVSCDRMPSLLYCSCCVIFSCRHSVQRSTAVLLVAALDVGERMQLFYRLLSWQHAVLVDNASAQFWTFCMWRLGFLVIFCPLSNTDLDVHMYIYKLELVICKDSVSRGNKTSTFLLLYHIAGDVGDLIQLGMQQAFQSPPPLKLPACATTLMMLTCTVYTCASSCKKEPL